MPQSSSSISRRPFPRRIATIACVTLAFFASQRSVLADAPATSGEKFLRYAEAGDGVAKQLQTSIVRYETKDGVKVDLIGAVHVGDRAYYDELNRRFKTYDGVLYEMVKPKDMEGVNLEGRPQSVVGMLQRFMQDQLQLDFQLDRVDYTPKNFIHADLDAETFADRQAAKGESMMSIMLNQMMRELNKPQGEQAAEQAPMGIMDLIEALQSPDRSRQLKLVLAKQFNNMDDAMGAMGEGSVILDERNKHALLVLKKEMDGGKKHLAIFYGAAHLKGMDEMMTGLMGFKQVGEPEWLVAWDLTEKKHQPAPPLPAAVEPGGKTPTTNPAR